MASRTKRARSRKRRPRAASAGTATTTQAAADVADSAVPAGRAVDRPPSAARSVDRPRGGARSSGAPPQTPVSRRYGERPKPPWHPLPLSELLILVGAIGVLVGLGRGLSHGGPPLFAGLVAVALGTLEVTLREHRSGFRSHTIMLAALPVVIFHSAIALGVSAFAKMPAAATIGLLAIDVVLFLAIFRLLRSRFLTARSRAAGRSCSRAARSRSRTAGRR